MADISFKDPLVADNEAVVVGVGLSMAGLVFDDTTPVVVVEGDVGYQRMSADREGYTIVRDAAGNNRGQNVNASGQALVVEASAVANAASNAAIQAAVEIMDDWDETNRAAVNLIAGQVGIQGGTGIDTALSPRVSLATDIPLPAGTNAIGKLSANSGVDIGDVDILSQIPGVGATNLGKAVDTAVGATDTGVAMLVQRVDTPGAITPALNDYTVLRVDANGRLHTTDPNAGAGTPTTPLSIGTKATTPTNVAAGAVGDIDSGDMGDLQKVTKIEIWGSAPYKVRLYMVDDGVEATDPFGVGGGQAFMPFVWNTPHKNYAVGSTGGVDQVRAEVTNLHDTAAADFYAVFHHEG